LIIKFVRAVKSHAPEVEVWGSGKPIREWLYVKDFAMIIRRVVEARKDGMEPINIAQNKGHSVLELVDAIRQQVGYTGQITYNTRYQDGSPKKVMDDHLFRQHFPDFEFTPFQTGIAETIQYYHSIL
jgi:GDP-L-fucose synthase